MKILIPLFCILLEVCLVSGNLFGIRRNSFGIIASHTPRGNRTTAFRISSSTPSTIKLLDNQSQASQQLLHHLPHTVPNPQPSHTYPRYPESIPHKKSGPLYSALKSFGLGQNADKEENEPEHENEYQHQPSRVERHEAAEGWGWSKPKKHKVSGGGGGGSEFSLLDLLLSGLSLVSFGAFLMNLMASLLSLLFGSGLFSNTLTYPYYYTTGTSTTGGGGGSVAVRIANRIKPYFRDDLKKKYSSGTIQADAGIGNIIKNGTSGWVGNQPSGEEPDFDDDNISDSEEAELVSNNKPWGRAKRSIYWEPTIDAPTSINIAAKSILNSIQSMNSNYQCMEKVVCDSNRHAKIIKRGLEYFMPIYTFTASYFGQKWGLHSNLPAHLRGIILGVKQDNCRTNFPQCSHP